MSEIATTTLLIYGALLIVGGVLGYVLPEKPSKISLFAGGGTGLLAVAGYFLAEAPTIFVIGAVVALLNTVAMGVRWKKTGKFMPAGLVTLISLAVLALSVSALVQ